MAKHILIVDDQADLLLLMRKALEGEGYRVSAAADAQEALRIVAAEVPDLVVSDIMMPVMDGIELVQHMRADRRLLGVPVVLLTAAATVESVEARARAVGVEHFLAKPFNARRLLATVRGTLERFAQLREVGVLRAPVPEPVVSDPGADLIPTGIGPLDDLTGGLPERRAYYLTGDVGTGKGVAGIQFVDHGLARGEGAIIVTTDRPTAVLRLAEGVGLDLGPFLRNGRLVLLELDGDIERLLEAPEDLRVLAAELGRYAREAQATRLTIGSVLTLLCASSRLTLTSATVSTFLRDLEETGLTSMLIGDHPATEQERLADAFLRRAAFGSFHLATVPDQGDVRVLTAERLLSASVDAAGRRYRIQRGVGLVGVAQVEADTLPAVRARIDEALVRARAGGRSALVADGSGKVRVRDAWALTFRECASEALRVQERCAVLVAQLQGDHAPAGRFAGMLTPLWEEHHLPCWVGEGELVVFGLGADRSAMARLARRIKGEVDREAAAPVDLRCAVASFCTDGSAPSGEIEALGDLGTDPPGP